MPGGAQVRHHGQRFRQRAAIACWTYADVHGSDEAQFCCRKARQTPQPDGVVCMNLEALVADGGLHGRGQRADALRRHEAARVLQVEQVDERAGRERTGEAGIERVVMHVRQRERECAHDFRFALLLDETSRFQHGIGIVHRVEHDEATDAIALQVAIHQTHEIRVGLLPGDEAQARGDELQWGTRHGGAHAPDALPRVVAEVAHGHRHVRRGREVDGCKARAVREACDLQHLRSIQAGGTPETLVAVAHGDIDKADFSHGRVAPGSHRRNGYQRHRRQSAGLPRCAGASRAS